MPLDNQLFFGHHIKGAGEAKNWEWEFQPPFNCKMVGTFNVEIPKDDLFDRTTLKSSLTFGNAFFYLARLTSCHGKQALAFAYEWKARATPTTLLEFVSKRSLDDDFKQGLIQVTFFRKWEAEEIATWAERQYLFHTFDWSPKPMADCNPVWSKMRLACSWANRTVLDIGANTGWFSMAAAGEGAEVIGVEPEESVRLAATLIDRHIHQKGVEFVAEDSGGDFDIILYQSVHHMIDPSYELLPAKIRELKQRCSDLFVELILPSSGFGYGEKFNDVVVDKLVNGDTLLTYQHNVRGRRRLYHVKGEYENKPKDC